MQIRIKKMQMEILQKIDAKQNAISQSHQYYQSQREFLEDLGSAYLHGDYSLLWFQTIPVSSISMYSCSDHGSGEHCIPRL
jgi:hypothetical protein